MKRTISRLKNALSHPLAKGSVIVFAGSMTANAGAYLYHLVVGRILGPSGYGELAALLSLSYILNVFAVMLQTVVTKFVAEKTASKQIGVIRELVIQLTVALLVVGVVCVGLLFVIAPYIASFLHIRDASVIFFLFIGIALTLLGIVYSSVLQGAQRFTQGMILLNVNALLRLAAGASFASLGVTAALAANTVAVLFATLISLWMIRDFIFGKRQTELLALSPLFRTSITTFLAVLGISVLNSQDVVVVKHFLPALQSGWYGALATMGKIIFFASYSVAYVLLPIVSDRTARGTRSHSLVYISVGIVSVISLSITTGFFLLPKLALGLLYGSAFLAAAPYLGLFGMFSSLYTIAYTMVMALIGAGKTMVWILLIGIAIAQDLFLAYFHSSISIVISVNIAISVALVLLLLLYYRHAYKDH